MHDTGRFMNSNCVLHFHANAVCFNLQLLSGRFCPVIGRDFAEGATNVGMGWMEGGGITFLSRCRSPVAWQLCCDHC